MDDLRSFLTNPIMLVFFWPGFLLAAVNSLLSGLLGLNLIGMLGKSEPLLGTICYCLSLCAALAWVSASLAIALSASKNGKYGLAGAGLTSPGALLFIAIMLLLISNPLHWALAGLFGIDAIAFAFSFLPVLARPAYVIMALLPGLFLFYLMGSEG